MSDLEYWTNALRAGEQELDAATKRSDINAAAKKAMLSKAELRRLEKAPTRRASGVAAVEASS